MSMLVWRVGHISAPCDFPPHHVYAWDNRFDDSERKYRTIYCADEPKTCLREVLADFRTNTKALVEFNSLPDSPDETAASISFGVIRAEWRRKKSLAKAQVKFFSDKRKIIDIENFAIRLRLTIKHSALLRAQNIDHLDISELRGKNRFVTQILSRSLFDEGNAGIKFRSHLDNKPCYAFFEFRANLKQHGQQIPLTTDTEELLEVCREFGLKLEPL